MLKIETEGICQVCLMPEHGEELHLCPGCRKVKFRIGVGIEDDTLRACTKSCVDKVSKKMKRRVSTNFA